MPEPEEPATAETEDPAGTSQEPKAAPAPRPTRPLVAGILLLSLVGLGLFNGILQVASPGQGTDESLRFSDITWTVEGTVHAPNGTALADVTIVSNESPETSTTTDANGTYRLGGLAAGFNSLNFSHADQGNLTLNLILLQDASADVEMPPPGEDAVVDHHSVADQRTIGRTWGVVILVLTLATAAGAVAAYRRGPRKLAIAGCVTGSLVLLPLSLLLAAGAIFLVLRNKAEWR